VAQIILEKVDYLRKVARHAYGMVDENGKATDRETGGLAAR
jgi:hypothetical protein